MPAWKVLFIMTFAFTCLALAISTVVVPMTLESDQHPWLWLSGLLVATVIMSTLLTLFLKNADRTFKR